MPITRIKDGKGRTRYEFEFKRRFGGKRRFRVRKLLPAGWSRSQADAFDRQESARLYAQAVGVEQRAFTIEQAVARYNTGRVPELKHGANTIAEIDALADIFTGRPLSELPEVCAEYLKRHRANLAPATIKNRLRYLVAACRYGWRHHKMGATDPGAGVVYPAVSNERQVYVDRRQMLALARACPNRAARAAIRIAYYSGMRLGEIERAERDLEASVFILDDTKNGEPRIVPMHRKVRCCAGIPLGTRYQTSYHFRAARVQVGLQHLHFHDLRHSAASAMLAEHVPLHTIGAVLGHKSGASTRRYAHLATQALRDAVGLIGKRA